MRAIFKCEFFDVTHIDRPSVVRTAASMRATLPYVYTYYPAELRATNNEKDLRYVMFVLEHLPLAGSKARYVTSRMYETVCMYRTWSPSLRDHQARAVPLLLTLFMCYLFTIELFTHALFDIVCAGVYHNFLLFSLEKKFLLFSMPFATVSTSTRGARILVLVTVCWQGFALSPLL